MEIDQRLIELIVTSEDVADVEEAAGKVFVTDDMVCYIPEEALDAADEWEFASKTRRSLLFGIICAAFCDPAADWIGRYMPPDKIAEVKNILKQLDLKVPTWLST